MLDEADGPRSRSGPVVRGMRRPACPRPASLRERAARVPGQEAASPSVAASAPVEAGPGQVASTKRASRSQASTPPERRRATGAAAPMSRVARARAARAAASATAGKELDDTLPDAASVESIVSAARRARGRTAPSRPPTAHKPEQAPQAPSAAAPRQGPQDTSDRGRTTGPGTPKPAATPKGVPGDAVKDTSKDVVKDAPVGEPAAMPKGAPVEVSKEAALGAPAKPLVGAPVEVSKEAALGAPAKPLVGAPVEVSKEVPLEAATSPGRQPEAGRAQREARSTRTRREAVSPKGTRQRSPARPRRPRAASAGGARAVFVDTRRLTTRRQLLTLGGMMLLVVLWLALAVLTSATVSARTKCSGVSIGGMSHAEAAAAIEAAYADKAAGPLLVSADGATVQIDGAAVNATVDGEASIAGLSGYSLNPLTIMRRLIGGQEVEVVATADLQAVREQLSVHLPQLSHGAVSASVSIVDGKVERSAASPGTGVDIEAASQMLSSRWPAGATTAIALPEGVAEPVVTDAEAKAFATNVVEPLLAGDITLTVADTAAEGRALVPEVTLSAQDILDLTSIKEEAGALAVSLEPTRLRELVLEGFGPEVETAPTGFTWSIDGSQEGAADAKPELVPATPGKVVDGAVLSKAIVEGVSNSGASAATRKVPLVLAASGETAPGSESEAQAMGITEVVGGYSTPFDSDPDRDQNLRAGAAAVNSTLVLPGQTYSMVDTIGPVEPGRGYTEAGVIVGANHVNGLGGGLSQVTTTVFNAAYEAGMEDDEHTPHSQYMSRYPEGREATMWQGQIDMRFTNSTPYALLLQAWVADGQVHVRVWSTRYYDVSITTSERFNVVPQQTLTSSTEDCLPNPEGQPGFDITITRQRSLNGQALPAEVRTVHYEPNNTVVCG